MTRVRFDPSFVEHERWERLGADALVLHVTAVSYTVRTLSDGVISRARLQTLTPLVKNPKAVIGRLLADGLWTELADGTIRLCDVHKDLRQATGRGDEQPSRAFVEEDRAKAQARKEKWRAKQAVVGNAVPNAVPNGDENAAQSTAMQSSAVQGPEGPSPCSALDTSSAEAAPTPATVEQTVRRLRKHRPKWTENDVRIAVSRLHGLLDAEHGDVAADTEHFLVALATRSKPVEHDLGDWLRRVNDDDIARHPFLPRHRHPSALEAAARARRLEEHPNGADARQRAKSIAGPGATAEYVDVVAEQELLAEEAERRTDSAGLRAAS